MNRIPYFLRWLAGGLVAVAVLTALFALKGEGQPNPLPTLDPASPTPSTPAAPVVGNLLVQVTDDSLRTVASVLLSRDGTTLRGVTMDPHLVCDFGQLGLQTLSSAGPIVPLPAMQETVQRSTDMRVDGVLTLQRLAFAGLIDSVGGVTVTVDRPMQVSPDPANPTWVGSGSQVLAGVVAADYALYRGPREAEAARVSRFSTVLSAVLSALPRDTGSTSSVISALGSTARSTVPTDAVSQFLVGLNTDDLWRSAQWTALPTALSVLEQDAASTWLRVDVLAVADLAREVGLAPREGPLRVVVDGGSAAQRLTVRDLLRENGYVFIDGGGNDAAMTAITIDQSLTSFGTREFVLVLGLRVTGVATVADVGFGDIELTIGSTAEGL